MTKQEAVLFVEKNIRRGNDIDKTDLIVDKANISDAYTHWIIPVQSKRYLDSGNSEHALIGITPYAIDKATGKIDHDFDTSVTIFSVESLEIKQKD